MQHDVGKYLFNILATCGNSAANWAFAILISLPLLPLGALVVNGQPVVVFFTGAAVFLVDLLLLTMLTAVRFMPTVGSPPEAMRFRFTIRDLLCLTMFVIGIVVFMISGFRCEAAERAAKPNPLPAAVILRFVWEMESGLVLLTIVSIIWIRSVRKRRKNAPCDFASPSATCSG